MVVDASVLAGNKDDKTYNTDTLKQLDNTLGNLKVNKEEFYYIADSALFSQDNLDLAGEKNIHLITRIPDNVLIAKEAIKDAVDQLTDLQVVTIKNAKGDNLTYRLLERISEYQGHPLKIAVCYSEGLKATKEKTIAKAVEKEADKIAKLAKSLAKREFACEEDVCLESSKIQLKDIKKLAYHDIEFKIRVEECLRRGRPSKDTSSDRKSVV